MDFEFGVHVPRDSPDIPHDNFLKRGVVMVMRPLNLLALNANSSKMVKAMNFRFAEHVPRDSLK